MLGYPVALCCDILHQCIHLCLEISVCYGAGQCEFERAVSGLCFLCIRDLCHLIYFIYSDCHKAASLFVSGYTYVQAVTIILLCNYELCRMYAEISASTVSISSFMKRRVMPASCSFSSEKSAASARKRRHISSYLGTCCPFSR